MAHFETTDDHQPNQPNIRLVAQANDQADPDDPWHLSPQVKQLRAAWRLPSTLMGGTRAMRAARQEFLPQEPAETPDAYEVRVHRSILFNAFRDTVGKLSGKPFTRDVKIKEESSAELFPLESDIDRTGRSLTQLSAAVLEHGWVYGLAHLFVALPQAPPGLTVLQERERGLRPYLIEIHPHDILGWRSDVIDGAERLTQLRRRECSEAPDGAFGSKMVDRVRVYDRLSVVDDLGNARSVVQWRLFEKDGNGKPSVVGQGELTLGEIPLVTMYVRRTGFLTADPPLEDLAWVNLAHWQSASDQRNILRIARVGLMFGSGISSDELGHKIPLGPSILLTSERADAKLVWVEHGGKAIGAGRQDLVDLKEEMMLLGLEPMLARPSGGMTATQASIETAQSHASLRASVIAQKQALEQALTIAAKWMNVQQPVASVDINEDFGISARDAKDSSDLIALRRAGDISRETLWSELQRRNVLSEDFDAEGESKSIATSTPPASGMPKDPEPDPE